MAIRSIGNLLGSSGQAIESESFVRIYQLAYFSMSLIPILDGKGRDEIVDILGVATKRNARSGVTGALTYNEIYFAQVLEGPYEAVKRIFQKISSDDRHTKVTVLQEGWVDGRDFSQWAMAYVGDETSMEFISTNVRLNDILSIERPGAALSLIEMLKFWLLHSP